MTVLFNISSKLHTERPHIYSQRTPYFTKSLSFNILLLKNLTLHTLLSKTMLNVYISMVVPILLYCMEHCLCVEHFIGWKGGDAGKPGTVLLDGTTQHHAQLKDSGLQWTGHVTCKSNHRRIKKTWGNISTGQTQKTMGMESAKNFGTCGSKSGRGWYLEVDCQVPWHNL